MHIRHMSPEDYGAVRNVLRESDLLEQYFTEEKYNAILAKNGDDCFLAEVDGKVVGTIMGMDNGATHGYLGKLAVLEHFRNRGIGKALAERALEGFRQKGINLIFCHVEKENDISRNLLASLGFEVRDSHHLMDLGYRNR